MHEGAAQATRARDLDGQPVATTAIAARAGDGTVAVAYHTTGTGPRSQQARLAGQPSLL